MAKSAEDKFVRGKDLTTVGSEVKSKLSLKQDNIADLQTIRSGAALGATALQYTPVGEIDPSITPADYATREELNLCATKAEVNQLGQEVDTNKTNITNLQQEIDDIQPIIIEGNVTNAPDEEDITTDENDLLKFANRPTAVNQMGYFILRKNKTFAEQVTQENTIYEIRYAFSIDDVVTLPLGSRLVFNGGSLNINGTIITDTTIDALVGGMFPNIQALSDYNAERLVSLINAGFSVKINDSFYIGTASSAISHDVELSGIGKLIKTNPTTASFEIGPAISIRVRDISLVGNYNSNLSNYSILFSVPTSTHIYNDSVVFENCDINNVRVYSHVADDVDQVTVKDGVKNFIFRNNRVSNIGYFCVRCSNCLSEYVEISGNTITKFMTEVFGFGLDNTYQTLPFPRLKTVVIRDNYVDNEGYVMEDGATTTYHTPFLVEAQTCIFNNNTIRNILSTATEIQVAVYAAYLSANNVEMRGNYIYNVINLADSRYNECFKSKGSVSGGGQLKRTIIGNTYVITGDILSTYTPFIKLCDIQASVCEFLDISDNTIDVRDIGFTFGGGSIVKYRDVSICRNYIICKYVEDNAAELFRLETNAELDGNIYVYGNRVVTKDEPTALLSLFRGAEGYKIVFENNDFSGYRISDYNSTVLAQTEVISRNNIIRGASADSPYNIRNIDYFNNEIELLNSPSVRIYLKGKSVYKCLFTKRNPSSFYIYPPSINTGLYKITMDCGLGKSSIYCRADNGNLLFLNDAGSTLEYSTSDTETKQITFQLTETANIGTLSVTQARMGVGITAYDYRPCVTVEYYPSLPISAYFGNKNSLSGAVTLTSGIRPYLIWKNQRIGYVKNGRMYGANGLRDGALSGATADRPSLSATDAGFIFFDTTLGKSIVWNGSAWVNMDGSALS